MFKRKIEKYLKEWKIEDAGIIRRSFLLEKRVTTLLE